VGQSRVNTSLFDEDLVARGSLRGLGRPLPQLEGEAGLLHEAEAIRSAFVASFEQLLAETPDSADEPESPFHPLAEELHALRFLLVSTRSATWWNLVPGRHGADVRRYLRCRAKGSPALDLLENRTVSPPRT